MADTSTTFNDRVNLEAREAGPARFPVPPVGDLPAGGATHAVPHYLSKIGLINQIARSYRWAYDEALKDSRKNAVAMLRDVILRDALFTRIAPTSQLMWHLEPRDPTDPRQIDAAAKLTDVIKATPRLQDLFFSLLYATWFGRQGVSLRYEWDFSHPDGKRRMVVRDHLPINGDTLVARWATNEWGMYVNGLYPGIKEPADINFVHFFTPAEREAIIVHCHVPEDADFYEPELAGQIRGSGLRGHLYWYWYLASNFLALVADYGERFANGIWIAYYPETNPEAKTELENALAAYKTSKVLELPKRADGTSGYGIEIREVSASSPQFLLDLVVNFFYQYMRAYITGSSLSHETAIGVGGDAVGLMEDRISRVVKFDANRLAETLSVEWMPVLTRYNCGESVPPPFFKFDLDTPDAARITQAAVVMKKEFGVDVNTTHLMQLNGLPEAAPGSSVSSEIQPLQPVAVNQTPQGVAMAANAGPTPVQPQQAVPVPPPQQSTVTPVDGSALAV